MRRLNLTRKTLLATYRARESGLSWREVGEKFGISRSSARRAYLRIVAQVVKESSSLEQAKKRLDGQEGRP